MAIGAEMCAEKTSRRPSLQRVARHLYRRGNSFEFFRRIPPDARHLFGGLATKSASFGDVSRREAEHRAAALRMQTDRLIAQARNRADPAGGAHDHGLRVVPSQADMDRVVRTWVLDQTEQHIVQGMTEPEEVVRQMDLMAELTRDHLRGRNHKSLLTAQWVLDALVARHNWRMDDAGRAYLFDRLGRAQREMAIRVKAELNFDDTPAPTHRMFDPAAFVQDEAKATATAPRVVPIMDVFDRYAAEQQPEPKTIKKWKTALNSLITYLGHDDAGRVQPDDVIKWKDFLLAPDADGTKPRGQGTVRNGYLGAIKPVFEWAKANKLIAVNPAAGVTVSVPKRKRNRAEMGFTDEEAKVVLSAATKVNWSDGTYSSFAYRWVPWICAYTGARVGEIAQLRDIDVGRTKDGTWFITITPEAGSQKGRFARQVPLHPHLIDQGLIGALEGRKGPLFYDPARKRDGSTGNPQYVKVGERVARWVRALGITDSELQPNHGWRHRFTTVARDAKIDRDVREAIMGHVAQTEHGNYGDVRSRAIATK